MRAITHDSVFAQARRTKNGSPGRAWKGGIVLTKDKLIRKRALERNALVAANVPAFVFTGGNMSGVEMAESIVKALPRILRIIGSTTSPFIARVTGSGAVDVIEAGGHSG